MKKRALLLTAIAVASVSYASDWSLDANVGYSAKIANLKEVTKENVEAKLPVNLKLSLNPSDVDLKWSFEILNKKLNGFFATNELGKTGVFMDASYKTPALVGGLKLGVGAKLGAYNDGADGDRLKTGELELVAGPSYTFDNGVVLGLDGIYKSNQLVTPLYAGAKAYVNSKYVDAKLEAGYDFTLDMGESKVKPDIPVTAKLNLDGKYSNALLSYMPKFEAKTTVKSKILANGAGYAVMSSVDANVKPVAFKVTPVSGLSLTLDHTIKNHVELEATKLINGENPEGKRLVNTISAQYRLLNETKIKVDYSKSLGKVTLAPYFESVTTAEVSPTRDIASAMKNGSVKYNFGRANSYEYVATEDKDNVTYVKEAKFNEGQQYIFALSQKLNAGLNVSYMATENLKLYGSLGLDSEFQVAQNFIAKVTTLKSTGTEAGDMVAKTALASNDYASLVTKKGESKATEEFERNVSTIEFNFQHITPKAKVGLTFTW